MPPAATAILRPRPRPGHALSPAAAHRVARATAPPPFPVTLAAPSGPRPWKGGAGVAPSAACFGARGRPGAAAARAGEARAVGVMAGEAVVGVVAAVGAVAGAGGASGSGGGWWKAAAAAVAEVGGGVVAAVDVAAAGAVVVVVEAAVVVVEGSGTGQSAQHPQSSQEAS
ncbi:unnamed protein product [Closterium sp. NIES-65]|nr:unnamed protein product [Closterium sp. NIES-65]